ncbi:eukaryotic peptide chain release factor subunit 1-like isoform X2 [Paramacrobiotus metropolitanus]|uniref:eukaryotic peptide chain release factor subunit 1-like isoform X2 n=1 Tax=Paramacrobiotus metropolitanus TaxID=2943436 RepID=UPI0024458087|nr:eukaryotic peptide chain release factor subunit 1-like isoform X2 [Paramacrobiotus metropolitanus]
MSRTLPTTILPEIKCNVLTAALLTMFQKCRYAPNAQQQVQELQLQVQELQLQVQELLTRAAGYEATISDQKRTISDLAAQTDELSRTIGRLELNVEVLRAGGARPAAPKPSEKAPQALLADDTKYGFIVMGGDGALFGTLQGNTREILLQFKVELPKKCDAVGHRSAGRFARRRVEKRHNYVRKVAEAAVTCFIAYDRVNVAGLVLAGSADFKKELEQPDIWDQRLQDKIVKIVEISYGGMMGFNNAIELSADCLTSFKFVQVKMLIGKFFDEMSQDTGKVCFGVDDTVKCLESGAVETLICWENLDIMRYVLCNTNTGEKKIVYLRRKQTIDKIKLTDTGTALEEDEKMGLLKWLAYEHKNFDATLEIVTGNSPEVSQFVLGFGGIGGILRCQMKPQHFDTSLLQDDDNAAKLDLDLDDYNLDDYNDLDDYNLL